MPKRKATGTQNTARKRQETAAAKASGSTRSNGRQNLLPASFAANVITLSDVRVISSKYSDLIAELSTADNRTTAATSAPSSLKDLEQWRSTQLPSLIEQRKGDIVGAWFTKEEVVKLIQWKLKRGKFRPRLLQLVQSNPTEMVESVTREVFIVYDPIESDAKDAASVLCKLSGIGPASASLLLSVFDPVNVPFFSDEAYRWVMFEDGKGNGWDRSIKYDAKTYGAYCQQMQDIRKRLSGSGDGQVSMFDLETVGFVLGKEAELGRNHGAGNMESLQKKAGAQVEASPGEVS